MKEILLKGYIDFDGEIKRGYIITEKDKGIILEVGIGEKNIIDFNGIVYEYGEECIIEAGDFNGHSHPEQSIYTDIVDKNWDLPTWCRNTIYKYSPILKPEHIYFGCCRAFSRMLQFGVTSVMVSFYCHNNKGNLFDKEVLRAARDTGIRLYYGRMNYDIINFEAYESKVNSQRAYYEAVDTAEENFLRLMDETDDEKIVIAPSIHSIHASTREAIINSINLGNRYGRNIQFHLSEDRGDVDMSLRLYNSRPIEFLVNLLKNHQIETLENMFLSDCVWIDDNERRLIKEYNMKVVLNPRMNDRIKTGEADLEKLLSLGITPYVGTDGEASNDDLSIKGEREFLKERFKNVSGGIINNLGNEKLKFGNACIGKIEKGNYCDVKVMKNGGIKDVFVGGKMVVKCGKLITVDVDNYIENKLTDIVKRDLA